MKRAWLLWIVIGCGGDADPLPSEREVAACRELLSATCEQVERCGAPLFEAFEGDLERCITARLDHCVRQFLPGSRVAAEDVERCASEVAARSCGAAIRSLTGQAALCESIPGERALGEACDADAQCESGFCDQETVTACGMCVAAPGAGDSCVDGDQCAPGFQCAAGGCIPLHDVGEACGQTARCFADLQCSTARTCAATIPLGGTCDPFQALNPCGFSNFCNEQTLVCEPMLVGSTTCGRTGDGRLVMCEAGLTCKLVGTNGNCIPVPGEGEACAVNVRGPQCANGLTCEAGVCVALQAVEDALHCE